MLSVIIPAHNEAKRLESEVEKLVDYLSKNFQEFEIIIAEDGSTDGTDRIASELEKKYPHVRHIHSRERLGKGRAIYQASKSAKYPVVLYMDADLSTDLNHVKEFFTLIQEGYDIVVGSRLLKESRAERPLKRDIPSRIYNFLARMLLKSGIRDHQCGFKAFRKEVLLELGKDVKDNHWFWDTELLVLAQRRGLKVKEVPVKWRHRDEGTVNVLKTSIYLFSSLLKHSERAFLYFSLIVTALIFLTLIYFVKPEKLADAFNSLSLRYVSLAFLIYIFSFILRGVRYELIMRAMNYRIGVGYAILAISISQTLNVITPVRIGDLGRAYVYSRRDVSYQSSFSGLAAERIYDVVAVLSIAFASILYVGFYYVRMLIYAVAFLALIILGVVVLSRTKGYVARVMEDAKNLIFSRKAVVFVPLSVSIWIVDVLVCYFVLLSFTSASIFIPAFGVAMGNVVKILPLTPGGIGTYEAVLTLVLGSVVSNEKALAVAIADHAIKNVSTILLGLISSIRLGLSLKELRE